MTCSEYWDRVNQGELEAVPNADHLAECAACATRWDRERALEAGLKLLSTGMRSEEAPSRVEAGLLAAFRAQAGRRQSRGWSMAGWMPALSWAAAAAATVALAVVLLHSGRPAMQDRAAPVVTPHRATAPTVESADVSSDAADDATEDVESEFIPVPNAARLEPNEDVNMVRVEMPRSALLALGIVVSDENTSEKVLADVVLGSDGMPRSVRLVSDGSLLEE